MKSIENFKDALQAGARTIFAAWNSPGDFRYYFIAGTLGFGSGCPGCCRLRDDWCRRYLDCVFFSREILGFRPMGSSGRSPCNNHRCNHVSSPADQLGHHDVGPRGVFRGGRSSQNSLCIPAEAATRLGLGPFQWHHFDTPSRVDHIPVAHLWHLGSWDVGGS